VLVVATFELGDPITIVVFVKSDNTSVHRRPLIGALTLEVTGASTGRSPMIKPRVGAFG